MLVDNTPVQQFRERIWVKREDLCSPYPGPGFAKIRGVLAHIRKRPETTIACLDTFHSKAGWAVAYVCKALGKKAIDIHPTYKGDLGLRMQQVEAAKLGAELLAVPAGRSAILYHQAKKLAFARGAYMMPNALKLDETVEECAEEALRTDTRRFDSLVISASSGTITAGVLCGLARAKLFPDVWVHLGYDRSEQELRAYLDRHLKYAGAPTTGAWPNRFEIVNERFGYKDAEKGTAPFPCNPYYDLKAWQWLVQRNGLADVVGRVLFWNVGC